MPSTRVIITLIGAVIGLVAYFMTRPKYPQNSDWPLGWAMGSFILVYVLGNVAWGIAEGMREASTTKTPPGPGTGK